MGMCAMRALGCGGGRGGVRSGWRRGALGYHLSLHSLVRCRRWAHFLLRPRRFAATQVIGLPSGHCATSHPRGSLVPLRPGQAPARGADNCREASPSSTRLTIAWRAASSRPRRLGGTDRRPNVACGRWGSAVRESSLLRGRGFCLVGAAEAFEVCVQGVKRNFAAAANVDRFDLACRE